MAELPKYICFKVKPNALEIELERIELYETEETAYWKRCEDDTCYWFECSACGHEPLYTRHKQEILSEYCPYCWSLMIEEVDEDG